MGLPRFRLGFLAWISPSFAGVALTLCFKAELRLSGRRCFTSRSRKASSASSWIDAIRSRAGTPAVNGALWLVGAVTLQATLGILTLLNQVPMALALAHQAVAIAVLTLAVFQAERLAARQPGTAPQKLVRPVGQPG